MSRKEDGLIMNNQRTSSGFDSLDLGSNPAITIPMEIVEVVLTAEGLVDEYARAFVKEAVRVNPARAQQVDLKEVELIEYASYLLTKRIQVVNNSCQDFRALKSLYIPSFLQHVLRTIGKVVDRSYGLTIIPILESESKMEFAQALAVSEKIGSFINDLMVEVDAMPREIEGDKDVMSTALIAGYVRSYRQVAHPAATYVSAFLGMTIKKEATFSVLYRMQYDDLSFIANALLARKELFL